MKDIFAFMRWMLLLVAVFGIFLFFFYKSGIGTNDTLETPVTLDLNIGNSMKITSPAFWDKKKMPVKYTCDGDDVSPPLVFSNIPSEAKSLVLIVDDPDAPGGTWVHWVVYNINPDVLEIKENSTLSGSTLGTNDFDKWDYGGPCPPPGNEHRYFFKLYALDVKLKLPQGARKQEVEKAMEGHILKKTELVGLYER